MADNTRHLTQQQENALALILQGQTDGEVAQAVGVTRQTVNGWRNRDAEFAAELNRRRQELWGAQEQRLRNLLEKAVDVLAEDLDGEDLKLRQGAAVHVLRAVGLYGATLEPKGETDPELLETTWQQQELVKSLLR